MTKYIKKIYLNKENGGNFILAAKTKEAGHHVLDLDKDLKYLKLRIIHKKIKLATLKESLYSAKIEKSKKNGKIHYKILKVFKNINKTIRVI